MDRPWRIPHWFVRQRRCIPKPRGARGTRRTLGPQRIPLFKPQRGFTIPPHRRSVIGFVCVEAIAFPHQVMFKQSGPQGVRHSRDPGLWNLTPLAYCEIGYKARTTPQQSEPVKTACRSSSNNFIALSAIHFTQVLVTTSLARARDINHSTVLVTVVARLIS